MSLRLFSGALFAQASRRKALHRACRKGAKGYRSRHETGASNEAGDKETGHRKCQVICLILTLRGAKPVTNRAEKRPLNLGKRTLDCLNGRLSRAESCPFSPAEQRVLSENRPVSRQEPIDFSLRKGSFLAHKPDASSKERSLSCVKKTAN